MTRGFAGAVERNACKDQSIRSLPIPRRVKF